MTLFTRNAILVALIAFTGRAVRAQGSSGPFQVVTVGGRQASCPANGNAIPIFVTSQIPGGDLAFSTMIYGTPVILLNPGGVNQPFPIQLFMFAHECEHHRLGHIIGPRPPSFETDADCSAITRLKQLVWIGDQDAASIADSFRNNPARPPNYPAGNVRADNIMNCYNAA